MSLERAEADLAKAKAEMNRLRTQLEAASTKVMKLEHFIEVSRAYEAESGDEGAIGRSAGAVLSQACADIIRERGARQKTSALVDELEKRGHHIGGGNKITNLSGALSRSSELVSNRAKGWGLAEWGENGPTPKPPAQIQTDNEEILEKLGLSQSAPSWDAPPSDLDDEIPF